MNVEYLTAGIDWLSMTMEEHHDDYAQFVNACYKELEKVAKEGNIYKERRMLGYDGHSVGNCFVGYNGHSSFANFTGHNASRAFDAVYSPNAHISRLDIQISVKFEVMPKNIAKEAYRAAKRASDDLPNGRKRKVWIIVGSDGGDTTYVGSASSEQRARIYNKEVQSDNPDYLRTWRYEVVFKNDLSSRLACEISSRGLAKEQYITDVVCSWLSQRGIQLDYIRDSRRVALPIERTLPTDVERKLKWVNTQVAPTIKYLCDLGFRDTLLASLFPPVES